MSKKSEAWPGQAIRCVEEQYKWRNEMGLICEQTLDTARRRLSLYVEPFLNSTSGASPDERRIIEFVDGLYGKGLSSPTCKQILFLTKRVVEQAKREGLILSSHEAICPQNFIRQESVPRGGFRLAEYRRLVAAARAMSSNTAGFPERPFARSNELPAELPLLIRFMVNSFVRPSDLKNICHRHVEIVRGAQTYLRLMLPKSKAHTGVVVTLRPAVRVYELLKKIADMRGLNDPNTPVFYPYLGDRKTAMMAMDHHFRRVLEKAGLRHGERGQTRTLYSLRHTAITFRLLYGEGIDLLTLAKNARTSVQMIERFYASELTPEMNVALIQSRRRAMRN